MNGGLEFLFWLLLFALVIIAVAFTEYSETRREKRPRRPRAPRRDVFIDSKPEPHPRSSLEQFAKIIPKEPR